MNFSDSTKNSEGIHFAFPNFEIIPFLSHLYSKLFLRIQKVFVFMSLILDPFSDTKGILLSGKERFRVHFEQITLIYEEL